MYRREWKGPYPRNTPGKQGLTIHHDEHTVLASMPSLTNYPALSNYKVLGRCRYLVCPTAEKLDARVSKLKEGKRCAYVGFGSCMQGPVLLHGRAQAKSALKRKAGAMEGPDTGPVRIDFKVEPVCTIVGHGFLPHHSMLRPANFEATKRHVAGENRDSITPEERAGFDAQTTSALKALSSGRAPFVPDFVEACTEDETNQLYGEDTRARPDPAQRSCNMSVLLRGTTEPSGFELKVPLVDALELPEELLTILKRFAEQHHLDSLPLRLMITALMIWADIVNSEDMMMEPFFKAAVKTAAPMPKINAATAIIYLGHMLKWVEWMGLAEYPHFFRFCAKAVETDPKNAALSVDSEAIDEDRVLELLKEVKSRVDGIRPEDRLTIWPWMMPGSKLPKVHGPRAPVYNEDALMALTGLMNLSYYGLKDYSPPSIREPSSDRAPTARERLGLGPKHVIISLPDWVQKDLSIKVAQSLEMATPPPPAPDTILGTGS